MATVIDFAAVQGWLWSLSWPRSLAQCEAGGRVSNTVRARNQAAIDCFGGCERLRTGMHVGTTGACVVQMAAGRLQDLCGQLGCGLRVCMLIDKQLARRKNHAEYQRSQDSCHTEVKSCRYGDRAPTGCCTPAPKKMVPLIRCPHISARLMMTTHPCCHFPMRHSAAAHPLRSRRRPASRRSLQ